MKRSKSLVRWSPWSRRIALSVKTGVILLALLGSVLGGMLGGSMLLKGGATHVSNNNHIVLPFFNSDGVDGSTPSSTIALPGLGVMKQCLPLQPQDLHPVGMKHGEGVVMTTNLWCHHHRGLEEHLNAFPEKLEVIESHPLMGMISGEQCLQKLGRGYSPVLTPACTHVVRKLYGWEEGYDSLEVTPCDVSRMVPDFRFPGEDECI